MRIRLKAPAMETVDLTPMVDVVFLLIIFFLLASTYAETQAQSVQLPKVSAPLLLDQDRVLSVVVLAGGRARIEGGVDCDNPNQLTERARQYLISCNGRNQKPAVILKASAETPYERVMNAWAALKNAGVSNLSFHVAH